MQISIVDMLREEEERAERAEKAKAASHSGASRDVRGDASRRRSDARSALRTHSEETLDDPANANEPPRTHQSTKLWNEEELEHVMEDVAVRRPPHRFFLSSFSLASSPFGVPTFVFLFFCFVSSSRPKPPIRPFLASDASH